MSQILVFRVEHPDDGLGPYMSPKFPKDTAIKLRNTHNTSRHPGVNRVLRGAGVIDNCYAKVPEEIHSGCDSLETLDAWFEDFWEDFKEAGFRIYKYIVRDESCIKGTYGQIVFDMPSAERLVDMEIV